MISLKVVVGQGSIPDTHDEVQAELVPGQFVERLVAEAGAAYVTER